MSITDLMFELLIKLEGLVEGTVPFITLGFES